VRLACHRNADTGINEFIELAFPAPWCRSVILTQLQKRPLEWWEKIRAGDVT